MMCVSSKFVLGEQPWFRARAVLLESDCGKPAAFKANQQVGRSESRSRPRAVVTDFFGTLPWW